MSSTKRQHTIHSVQRELGTLIGVLERGWFSPDWCNSFTYHYRVLRVNHLFHVTSDVVWFTQAHAEKMVDAILRGSLHTVNLRELSVKHYPTAEEKRWKTRRTK